jgi:tryptophan synthase alpha chain
MNALQELLSKKKENLLSVFFTAGYPAIDSTVEILKAVDKGGVDFVEVGMPYSDPLADGPVIQDSNTKALNNGMNMNLLFEQLESVKDTIQLPRLLMGYLNPVLQYGMERFLEKASACNISGVILPDLPMQEFIKDYRPLFRKHQMSFISLITPQTSEERIRMIDENSDSFIYAVSTTSTTGKQQDFGKMQQDYFQRIKDMQLKNPVVAGFGIHNSQTLQQAWAHMNGAICGSAFLKKLASSPDAGKALEALMIDLGLRSQVV